MPIRIDTSDFDRRVEDFMIRKFPNMKRAVLNTFADDAKIRAFEMCPYDTKNLRTTIRKEEIPGRENEAIRLAAGGQGGRGNPPKYVDYALYVHEGTSRMAGRPFLVWGAQQALRTANDSEYKRAAFG